LARGESAIAQARTASVSSESAVLAMAASRDEVLVAAEEPDERRLRSRERGEPGRNRRLDSVVGDLPRLQREEPREIRETEIAAYQLRAERDERTERPLALLVVLRLLVLAAQIEDQMLAPGLGAHRVADEVRAERLCVHALHGDAKHQAVRPPVREVHVRVEVALHELGRIGLQIAPLVLVPETRRRDLSPRRDGAKFGHLFRRKRPIKRDELVALVLAHRSISPFVTTRSHASAVFAPASFVGRRTTRAPIVMWTYTRSITRDLLLRLGVPRHRRGFGPWFGLT
jgi:hypothetical protein